MRPDVDWLGHHFRPYEGRRSVMAWSIGALSLVLFGLAGLALTSVTKRDTPLQGFLIAGGLVTLALAGVGFFTGRPQGRWMPLAAAVPASGLFGLASDNPPVTFFFGSLILLVFAGAAFTDVRSKLFYRVAVPRPDLLKYYRRVEDNPMAVYASRVALVSLIVPLLGLVGIVMGVIGLARVNRQATPPVGNASTAIGAIIFSLLTTLGWAGSLAGRFL